MTGDDQDTVVRTQPCCQILNSPCPASRLPNNAYFIRVQTKVATNTTSTGQMAWDPKILLYPTIDSAGFMSQGGLFFTQHNEMFLGPIHLHPSFGFRRHGFSAFLPSFWRTCIMKTFHGIVSARLKSTEPKSGYQFVCLAFCRWLGVITPPFVQVVLLSRKSLGGSLMNLHNAHTNQKPKRRPSPLHRKKANQLGEKFSRGGWQGMAKLCEFSVIKRQP